MSGPAKNEGELVKSKSNTLFGLLKRYEKQIEASIPRHLTVERMLRLTVGAVNKNPKLLQCTPSSVLNSVLYLAQLGLEPRVNEAYLVPFKVKDTMVCTPMVDYRGKIKLARQSGLVKDIEPHLVHARDEFDLVWSTDPNKRGLTHKPLLYRKGPNGELIAVTEEERGKPVLGYAIGWLVGADPHTEVMTVGEIDRIRRKSKAANDGPWVTDLEQMMLKTLVHRLCKMLPQSNEMQMAQELDERNEMDVQIDPILEIDAADDQAPLGGSGTTPSQDSGLAGRVKEAAEKTAGQPTPADVRQFMATDLPPAGDFCIGQQADITDGETVYPAIVQETAAGISWVRDQSREKKPGPVAVDDQAGKRTRDRSGAKAFDMFDKGDKQ